MTTVSSAPKKSQRGRDWEARSKRAASSPTSWSEEEEVGEDEDEVDVGVESSPTPPLSFGAARATRAFFLRFGAALL